MHQAKVGISDGVQYGVHTIWRGIATSVIALIDVESLILRRISTSVMILTDAILKAWLFYTSLHLCSDIGLLPRPRVKFWHISLGS